MNGDGPLIWLAFLFWALVLLLPAVLFISGLIWLVVTTVAAYIQYRQHLRKDRKMPDQVFFSSNGGHHRELGEKEHGQ